MTTGTTRGDVWREISTLGFAQVSPFTRRVDEAQARMNAAAEELLASLGVSRPSPLGADSAASRVLMQVAALRRILHDQDV